MDPKEAADRVRRNMAATNGLILPRNLAVGQIKAAPLLFFDEGLIEESYRFCELRDLDALPSIDGDRLWIRNAAARQFDCIEMLSARIIDGATYAFDPLVRAALDECGVVFVREDGVLVGAFHASDFNHPAVGPHLYDLLSRYERALRALALAIGLTEKDLLEAASTKRRRDYIRFRKKSPSAPQLQVAFLDDLMNLVSKGSGLSLDAEAAKRVRDATMHSHEFVNQVDADTPDYVYDTSTFKRLFDSVQTLLRETRLVANRLNVIADLGQVGIPR